MNYRLRYYVAVATIWTGLGITVTGQTIAQAGNRIRKLALRVGGVDEEEARREREEKIDRLVAERRATPPDRYSIELSAWKGLVGENTELLELSPSQFAALKYTASAKGVAVESLLGDAVRKAVAV